MTHRGAPSFRLFWQVGSQVRECPGRVGWVRKTCPGSAQLSQPAAGRLLMAVCEVGFSRSSEAPCRYRSGQDFAESYKIRPAMSFSVPGRVAALFLVIFRGLHCCGMTFIVAGAALARTPLWLCDA